MSDLPSIFDNLSEFVSNKELTPSKIMAEYSFLGYFQKSARVKYTTTSANWPKKAARAAYKAANLEL